MAISKRMRERIDTLLSVYVGYLRGTSEFAGWMGKGRMDNNDVIGGSGLSKSNAESIYQMRFVQREHALLGQAKMMLGEFAACTHCGKHEVKDTSGENGQRHRTYEIPAVCPACGESLARVETREGADDARARLLYRERRRVGVVLGVLARRHLPSPFRWSVPWRHSMLAR